MKKYQKPISKCTTVELVNIISESPSGGSGHQGDPGQDAATNGMRRKNSWETDW